MQLEVPEESVVLGHEERDGKREELPPLDEDEGGWIGLALGGGRRLQGSGWARLGGAGAGTDHAASTAASTAADARRVAREQRLRRAQQQLLEWTSPVGALTFSFSRMGLTNFSFPAHPPLAS